MLEQYTDGWEIFIDETYYGMWCVRPKGDRFFNSMHVFHFIMHEDAITFKKLIEKAK